MVAPALRQIETHGLSQDARARPEGFRGAHRLEPRSGVEAPGRRIAARDIQKHPLGLRFPRPVDNSLEQHRPDADASTPRCDPHLKDVCSVRYRCIDPAPDQTDELIPMLGHQRKIPLGGGGGRETRRPMLVRVLSLGIEGASKRLRRIGERTQAQVSVSVPFVSSKSP